MRRRVNPLVGKTINRRAGCGKPARPVRREGEPLTRLSLPLSRPLGNGRKGCPHDDYENLEKGTPIFGYKKMSIPLSCR